MHRTPPSTAFASPLQHCSSESNLAQSPQLLGESLSFTNIASRNLNRELKRKNDDITKSDIIDLFTALRKEQDEKFSAVLNSISEVKVSLDSMSLQYVEVLQRLTILEEEKKASDTKVQILESKIDLLERHARSTSIELRNVPQAATESKEDLKKILIKTAEALKIPLDSSLEIKDIYRANSKLKLKPIIADFTTVLTRDSFLNSYMRFNKEHQSEKLSTETLRFSGPRHPVYISENLTLKDRKLFFQAREFAKANGFTHCWSSFARIFVRKSNDSQRVRIFDDKDFENLSR